MGYQQLILILVGRWLRHSLGFTHVGGGCLFCCLFVCFNQWFHAFFKVENLVDKTLIELTVWVKI